MILSAVNNDNKILIILATYNGELYIRNQLQSIIDQAYNNWVCYIYDDCSTDNTISICLDFKNKYNNKFVIINRELSSGSACNNFLLAYNDILLKKIEYDYIAFCDQDDVWNKNKLYKLSDRLKKYETPALVFSDLNIVDENLNLINKSFIKKISVVKSQYLKKDYLSVDNVIPGCSMMINRALVKSIGEIPKDIIMHDWWFVINACKFGTIDFIDEPLVLYRQHLNNSIGIKEKSIFEYIYNYKKQIIKPFNIWKMVNKIEYISKYRFIRLYFKIFCCKVLNVIRFN